MAGVVVAGHPHHRHNSSVAMEETGRLPATAAPPAIVMVPNPTFSFPMKPATSTQTDLALLSRNASRRPVSMHLSSITAPTDPSSLAHKRTASALPSFSFNAADTSGRSGHDTPPQTPDGDDNDEEDSTSQMLARRGHRRGGSEFVGGDSRFGVSSAISTSPVKTAHTAHPGRRRHGHQRSAALSVHEINDIMSSADVPPRLSSSLPTTPLETPVLLPAADLTRSASAAASASMPRSHLPASFTDTSPVRPSSRPRVEFVDRVEIIPRPLSTISSETEGSLSTIRNHSVNNSISSMISLGAASPSFTRTPTRTASESDVASTPTSRSRARSSIELSKRIEREGEWLKNKVSEPGTSAPSLEATDDEPATIFPPPTFKPVTAKVESPRKLINGYALGFERRRSEPLLSVFAAEPSRLSAVSLQETVLREPIQPATSDTRAVRRSSTHKLMDWARSKLHRKSKDFKLTDPIAQRKASDSGLSAVNPHQFTDPDETTAPRNLVAETDLDAVLGSDTSDDGEERLGTPPPPSLVDFNPAPFTHVERPHFVDLDDDSPLVDLDAALEPMRTPPLGPGTHRRPLHSSRSGKSFTGAGGHYQHRRVESEPALLMYQHSRTATPSQTSMEDVFEEEEEDEAYLRGINASDTLAEDERYTGVALVDAVESDFGGLRIHQGRWEAERPHSSYITPSSRLSVPIMDRPASLVEEIIVEETSPVDATVDQIEIVQAHEEPRASSLTKSSDSSAASTLLAAPTATLAVPKEDATSTFASSDITRRQGSFETPRLGTSASSIADNRTMSSSMTGEAGHEVRMSVDDVPSLTSSRSTMMSTIHANNSRRELSEQRATSLTPAQAAERRKKRASIQSLSQLVGGTFGPKSKASEDFRPQTAALETGTSANAPKKRENRLKKLLFWRPKQSSQQA